MLYLGSNISTNLGKERVLTMVATGLTANIVDQTKIITRLTKLTSENTLAPLLQLRGEYTSWN